VQFFVFVPKATDKGIAEESATVEKLEMQPDSNPIGQVNMGQNTIVVVGVPTGKHFALEFVKVHIILLELS
jgi:hypothetical protein